MGVRSGLVAVALAAVAAFVGPAGPAHACICRQWSEDEQRTAAAIVFTGVPRGATHNPRPDRLGHVVRWRFDVESVSKGAAPRAVDVYTGGGSGDCGYPFEVGRRYEVLASEDAGALHTSTCWTIRTLNAGTSPAAAPVPTVPTAATSGAASDRTSAGLLVAAALAVAAVAVLLRRRWLRG